MNSAFLPPDDPKLTAYALGELNFEENARMAEAIKGDAAAQAAVDEIRALALQLESALEDEPVLPKEVCVSGRSLRAPVTVRATSAETRAKEVIRFPALWVLGLAAACIMVVIASLPPPAGSKAINPSQETAAQTLPGRTPSAIVPGTVPAAGYDQSVLPVVDNRKRALAPQSDVNPAPLREDGLEKWRSITRNQDAAPSPAMTGSSPPAPAAESKAYQLTDYTNRAAGTEAGVASVQSGTRTDTDHAVTAQFEVVPVRALEAAKMEPAPLNPGAADAPLLAGVLPGPRELLTLKISYRHSAVDLTQRIEFPRIDPVLDLAFVDKNLMVALRAAGLDKKLKEAPPKGSKHYDGILSWPEEKPDSLVDTIKSGNDSLDTTKRTVE